MARVVAEKNRGHPLNLSINPPLQWVSMISTCSLGLDLRGLGPICKFIAKRLGGLPASTLGMGSFLNPTPLGAPTLDDALPQWTLVKEVKNDCGKVIGCIYTRPKITHTDFGSWECNEVKGGVPYKRCVSLSVAWIR